MTLSSPRLTYVKCNAEGLADYLNFGMNEDVMRYVTAGALSHAEAVQRYEAALAINAENTPLGYWMAYTKAEHELIVYLKIIDLKNGQHEVGYLVIPAHWNNGYASEITAALIQYAKNIEAVIELAGIVDNRNTASKKVLCKQGFEYYKSEKEEGIVEEYFRLRL